MVGRRPINDIESRPPEAGRLRFGITVEGISKAGKKYKRPEAVDYWIFTSPHRNQIEALAEIYGGQVTEWNEPKANPPKQWKLTTDTNTIGVWLPADSLNISYEMWAGNTCERRCDGIDCWVSDMAGRSKVSCVCAEEEGKAQCKAKSRLLVMLPGIPYAGMWRLDTSSEYFATEAPGMIAMVEQLQAQQAISKILLVLSGRQQVVNENGRKVTKQFVIPTIQLAESPQQIVDGLAQVGSRQAIDGPKVLALDSGWTEPVIHDEVWHDDSVVDAEIIEDERPVQIRQTQGWDIPPPGVRVRLNPRWEEAGQPKYIPKD